MAELIILKIKDRKMNVGKSKILIKNIGPGGLCFVSSIQFPLERDFTLQFMTTLIGKEITVIGTPVWFEEMEDSIYKYGVKFLMSSSETEDLMGILYELQANMKNNILFSDGSFTDKNASRYFEAINGKQSSEKVDFSRYKRQKL